MRVLSLNCGSSSIKSALIDGRRRLLDIRIENIGAADCRMRSAEAERALGADVDLRAAVDLLLAELRERAGEWGEPAAVAHRIVHGGERFVRPTLIDDGVLAKIEELSRLAPLHNPPATAAVRVARKAYPDIPHVAIFDTAWHATLPPSAREYALPLDIRARFGIRRFGFHGISHAHVMSSVAAHLHADPRELRTISCHLGAGASAAAIERGRSVETSMGMTPLEGLVMGTRAGDIDPGALLYLLQSGIDREALDDILNKRSGLTGVAGTADMRRIEERAAQGDEDARLALSVYTHRIRKYIGAYAAVMGGVDAIAFTGGVGENSATVRQRCTQRLEFLGAVLDENGNRNARFGDGTACVGISAENSRTKLLVVRADEELAMALEAAQLFSGK